MSEDTHSLTTMMSERIQSLIDKGDWEGALSTAKTTVNTALENYEADPSNLEDYVYSLEILGNVYRDHKNQADATEAYQKIIRVLEEEQGYNLYKGKASANLAMIQEDQCMPYEAKEYYKWAIQQLELADPPAPLELSGTYNNLAFIYENEKRYNEAEDLFTKALVISREELGGKDTTTADIWNNLGGLLYKAGKYDRAIEMHKSALDIRKEVLGENHHDVAQSWGNLAVAYAEINDLQAAKESFNNALEILEKSSDSSIGDYATINANFVHILKRQGHMKEAETIEKRVSKYIKKH